MSNKQYVAAEMEGWKYGSMKDSRIEEYKNGNARRMEGWDDPSRPPYKTANRTWTPLYYRGREGQRTAHCVPRTAYQTAKGAE